MVPGLSASAPDEDSTKPFRDRSKSEKDLRALNGELKVLKGELARATIDNDRLEMIIGLVGIGFGLLIASIIVFFSLSTREIAINSAKHVASEESKKVYDESVSKIENLNNEFRASIDKLFEESRSNYLRFESAMSSKIDDFAALINDKLEDFDLKSSHALARFLLPVSAENTSIDSMAKTILRDRFHRNQPSHPGDSR